MSTPVDEADGLDAVLGRMSGAELYRHNAFRVTRLPTDATPAQVRRSREEAVLAAKLGVPVQGPAGDLPPDPAPSPEEVRAAYETIRDPVARLTHELLWLRPAGAPAWSGADTHEVAVRTHCAVVEEEASGPYAPGSAEARRLDELWARALAAWSTVLLAREFWDHARRRVGEIGDPRLTTGTVRRLRERLPRHIVAVNAELALRAARADHPAAARLVGLVTASPFPADLVAAALREAARPAERAIRAACATARTAVQASEGAGGEAGGRLARQVAGPLREVAAVQAPDTPLATALSEEVAVVLNQCAVAHHHAEGPPAVALELLTRAGELARVRRTRELVAGNTEVVSASAVPVSFTLPAPMLPQLRQMCERGKVDRAAAYVRVLAGLVTDSATADQLRELAADDRSLVARVPAQPFRGSLLGCGVRPYRVGSPNRRGVFPATYVVTLLYLPLFPLARYLMDRQRVYARVPLDARARWLRGTLFLALAELLVMTLAGPTYLLGSCPLLLGLGYGWTRLRQERLRTWARTWRAR